MTLSNPITNMAVAVPHATNPLSNGAPRAIVCSGDGSLVCSFDGITDITIPCTAGQWLPIRPRYIRAASTGTYLLGY